jgi:hypothetical protein
MNISGIRDERNAKEQEIFLHTYLNNEIRGYIPSFFIPFYQEVFSSILLS